MTERIYDTHTVNRKIQQFTKNSRINWSHFSANELEMMLRHYDMIAVNEYYHNFDMDKECLIFKSQPDETPYKQIGDLYGETYQEESKWQQFKRWLFYIKK